MRVLLLNGAQNFKRHSDLLNFRNFPGYKLKIKIILRLTKIGDQALISISTILKFSADFGPEPWINNAFRKRKIYIANILHDFSEEKIYI